MKHQEGNLGVPEGIPVIPTDEELRKEMSDDELKAKPQYWVAYYLIATKYAERGFRSDRPVDHHGEVLARLRNIFPDLTEGSANALLLTTGHYVNVGRDQFGSPDAENI